MSLSKSSSTYLCIYIKLTASGKPEYCDLAIVLIVDDSFGYPSASHVRSKHPFSFLARHVHLSGVHAMESGSVMK